MIHTHINQLKYVFSDTWDVKLKAWQAEKMEKLKETQDRHIAVIVLVLSLWRDVSIMNQSIFHSH